MNDLFYSLSDPKYPWEENDEEDSDSGTVFPWEEKDNSTTESDD